MSARRARRRPIRIVVLLSAVVALVALGAPQVAAVESTFGTPTATASYGKGVTFSQPFTPVEGLKRIEILITTPGALGPLAVEVPEPACCRSDDADVCADRDRRAHRPEHTVPGPLADDRR